MSKRVVIIGAGASGTLVAIHLLRLAQDPITVTLIEKSGRFGPGIAFGTQHPEHLLNVPAGKMSAFPDDAGHFLNWLGEHQSKPVDAHEFLPRHIYGRYLMSQLEASKTANGTLVQITDEAVGFEPNGEIVLKSKRKIPCDMLVLALGNLPPGQKSGLLKTLEGHPRFIGNIWKDLLRVEQIKSESEVLILGTGLTMVDAVLSLKHVKKISAISRRGLLPNVHAKALPKEAVLKESDGKKSMAELLNMFRGAVREIDGGSDWRSQMDSLRSLTSRLWMTMSLPEKRRFLRHVRPFWDIHRHRLPPTTDEEMRKLQARGALRIYAGRLTDVSFSQDAFSVRYRRRGSPEAENLKADFILNCTGHDSDFRKIDDPLLASLLTQGFAKPDALSLGIAVDLTGQLISEKKIPVKIYAMGPLRKGTLWETTAIPEIRVQAKQLAETILDPEQ